MEYYNEISKGYEELHGEEQRKKLIVLKQNMKVKKNDLLLDVGCGSGISSDFDCDVIGIDPSIELLQTGFGKRKAKLLVCGVAEFLPFKDNSFGIVTSLTAIHNFNDIEKGLMEMKRVGKGKIGVSILKKSEHADKIIGIINDEFGIKERVEEDKDIMLIS